MATAPRITKAYSAVDWPESPSTTLHARRRIANRRNMAEPPRSSGTGKRGEDRTGTGRRSEPPETGGQPWHHGEQHERREDQEHQREEQSDRHPTDMGFGTASQRS